MKISFKNHHLFSSKSCNWMLIIALFGPLSSFGQINMMGQLKPISDGEKVVFVVEAWDTENWKQKDTIQLSADGKFNKTVKKMSGQCRLKIQPKPTQWLDFIIPTGPAGKSIDFGVIDRLRMNGLTAELKDPENIAYLKLNLAQRELQVAKDSFEQWILRAGVGTNPWHASYLAKHLALNTLCIQSAKDLKGTFTGDIVTRLYYSAASEAFEQNKYTDLTESAWQRQHALDHIPFDDPRILQHNRMMRLLIQYYKTYFYPDNNGTQHAMDQIMSYRKGNEMVDEWLFHFLWENSLIKKEDEPINYLISTYTSGCMEEIPGLDNSTNNRIIAFQNCVVGQPGADFKAMTITGDTTHLYGLEKPGK
ncbi:MAG: hypothetical protein ABIV51_03100, partial [Saprospiraceae bacterium]